MRFDKINSIYVPQRLKKHLWSIYTDKVTIISGRSGCGKSTFISEFISHTKNDVLPHVSVRYIRNAESWRDCFIRLSELICGERIELPLSVGEQLEARRVFESARPQRELLIVIDNPYAAGMLLQNPRVAELITDCAFVRLVVTADNLTKGLYNSAMAFGFTLITESELLLTPEETAEYFEICGMENADSKNAYDICGGHMMLTREYLEAAAMGIEPQTKCPVPKMHDMIWEKVYKKLRFAIITAAMSDVLDEKMYEELNKSEIIREHYDITNVYSDDIRRLINSVFSKRMFHIDGATHRVFCHHSLRKRIMEKLKSLPKQVGNVFGKALAQHYRRGGNNFIAFCIYTLSGETEAAFNCVDFKELTMQLVWKYKNTLLMALEKIPHNLAADMTKYLTITTMVMLTDKTEEASQKFNAAATAILTDRNISEHDRRWLLAQLCIMRLSEGRLSTSKMGDNIKRAWRYYTVGMNLKKPPFKWSIYIPSTFMQMYDPNIPLETQNEQILRYQGMYTEMVGSGRHFGKLYTAELCYYSGNFSETRRISEAALQKGFDPLELSDRVMLLLLCGRSCLYDGDYKRFGEVLSELMAIARQDESGEVGFMARHYFAILSCYDGSGEKNGYFMLCLSDTDIQKRQFCAAFIYLSQALILYVSKRFDVLVRRAPLFLETAERSTGILMKLKIKLLYAAALLETGNKNSADDILTEVFGKFKNSRLYGAFSEILAISRPLHAEAERLFGNEEYVRKTLALSRTLQRGIEVAFTYRLSKYSIRRTCGAVPFDMVRKIITANDEKRRALGLSVGEFGCCCLAAGGCSNAEIADILKRSPDSVKSCLKRAFSKLNIRTRKQLSQIVPLIGQ